MPRQVGRLAVRLNFGLESMALTPSKSAIVQAQSATSYNVLGIEHVVHMGDQATRARVMLVEMRIPAGLGVPLHVHSREDETFHVSEGRVRFGVGAQEFVASPGTTVFAPRDLPHSFRAAEGGPARMMLVITPGGLEAMFRQLGELGAGPPDLQRFSAIVSEYGISFV